MFLVIRCYASIHEIMVHKKTNVFLKKKCDFKFIFIFYYCYVLYEFYFFFFFLFAIYNINCDIFKSIIYGNNIDDEKLLFL